MKTNQEIAAQAKDLILAILFVDRLQPENFKKAVCLAEIFFKQYPDPEIADKLLEKQSTYSSSEWFPVLVRAAKLGASAEWREKLMLQATEDVPFILNSGLDDILTLAHLGVSQAALDRAFHFLRMHSEAYGYHNSYKASLEIMALGASQALIDKWIKGDMPAENRKPRHFEQAIEMARTGASQRMRESIVKESLKLGDRSLSLKAIRLLGRDTLTPEEEAALTSQPETDEKK